MPTSAEKSADRPLPRFIVADTFDFESSDDVPDHIETSDLSEADPYKFSLIIRLEKKGVRTDKPIAVDIETQLSAAALLRIYRRENLKELTTKDQTASVLVLYPKLRPLKFAA